MHQMTVAFFIDYADVIINKKFNSYENAFLL